MTKKASIFPYNQEYGKGFVDMEKIIIDNKSKVIKNEGVWNFLKKTTVCFFAFISGGTNVFNIFSPFGVSFCTLFFGDGITYVFMAFLSVCGRFLMGNNLFNTKYIIWGILSSLINIVIHKSDIKTSMWQKSFCTGISIFSAGIVVSAFYGFSNYIIITSFIESVAVFVFSGIMLKGFNTIRESPERKILSPEETVSFLIVAGVCIVSLGEFSIWGINIKTALCVFVSILGGYRLGASGGALAGAFTGFILMICFEGGSDMFSVLTISALAGGSLRKRGKLFSALSFFIVSTVMIFYINLELLNISWFKSVIFGIIIFYLIPEKAFQFINGYGVISDVYDSRYYTTMKNITEKNLKESSNSFYALSDMFKKLDNKKKDDLNSIKAVIDETGGKICKNCGLFSYCWEKDFYNTYKIFYEAVALCERRGQIFSDDFPLEFKNNCAKIMTLVSEINSNCEEYRSKVFWENRIKESRELVGQQLFAVGKILENMQKNIDVRQIFREDIENEIKAYFDSQKIEFKNITAIESGKGEITVKFKLKDTVIDKSLIEEVGKVINKSTGKKMRRDKLSEDNWFVYREAKRYNVMTASALYCKKGNTVSGDNFTFLPLSEGEFAVALSDGMGSGEEANRESFFAIELLESFFKAGFDSDISIKLINSALLLNSTKDSFATLDICKIDTYNKKAEFVKTGAASSYIMRNGNVMAIRQESLPIGIFSGAEVEKSTYDIQDKDIIIMVTDGIEDIIGRDTGEDEKWFEDIFSRFSSFNPKDIADYIMREAVKKTGGNINDDMTVVVSRIWEGL